MKRRDCPFSSTTCDVHTVDIITPNDYYDDDDDEDS